MATFVSTVQLTEQGATNVKDTCERANAFKVSAEQMGVEVRDIYWTLGAIDGFVVFDAPDDANGFRGDAAPDFIRIREDPDMPSIQRRGNGADHRQQSTGQPLGRRSSNAEILYVAGKWLSLGPLLSALQSTLRCRHLNAGNILKTRCTTGLNKRASRSLIVAVARCSTRTDARFPNSSLNSRGGPTCKGPYDL